jgi:hypothetical protein
VEDPLVRDHAIGDHPVLPATYALGWMIHEAERTVPGSFSTSAADFQVLKGVVFDGSEPAELRCELRKTGHSIDATLNGSNSSGVTRKFYRATVTVSPTVANAPVISGFEGRLSRLHRANPYENGTLFHGPSLQGIHRASDVVNGEMLLECRLDSTPGAAHTECSSGLYDPALADLLLQSTLVLARAVKHTAGLPLRIASAEFFRPLVQTETFWVLLDEISTAERQVVCRARACDAAGQVFVSFSGVSVSLSSELESKFAARTPVPVGVIA